MLDTGGQHSTARDTALIFFVATAGMMAAPVQMQPLAMLGKAVILEAPGALVMEVSNIQNAGFMKHGKCRMTRGTKPGLMAGPL